MKKCLICDGELIKFAEFGPMPIANGFLKEEDFENEYFFDLEVAYCEKSKMVQLINQPKPSQMFHENYAFFSGTSKNMGKHFELFADYVIDTHLKNIASPFVCEIGSNDGILLKNFKKKGIKHLGVEPSSNVANVAKQAGINTIVEFFDPECAKKIVKEHGEADAFLAANVMCHIGSIKSVVEAIKILIKDDGVVIFEDPYLGEVLKNTTYDQIYDEHVFLFSISSIQFLFNQFDMEIIDVFPQKTHGGSMRYVIANKGMKKISKKVGEFTNIEIEEGLTDIDKLHNFNDNCIRHKEDLMSLLKKLKSDGKTIAGYAATSKSTTVMNYCGINSNHLDCIYDTTPLKQNKYSPGTHVLIKPHSEFKNNYPDYALLFGYNHLNEILEKEKDFIAKGGKWIVYVPKLHII